MATLAPEDWRPLASRQAGLLARRQLLELGWDRFRVRNQIDAGRWAERTNLVVSTTTGPLSRQQTQWLGVLHGGPSALVGELSACEVHGLERWHRDLVTVMIPDELDVEDEVPGVRLVRTRRRLALMRDPAFVLPVCRIEPAVLHFAAYDRSPRTGQGALAAVVQQGLATPSGLLAWITVMKPLRRAPLFRAALADIEGGSQSLAELDVLRMCREHGLAEPARQVPRLDASGRRRFTDAEWTLPDGRVVSLEVDGGFHMDAERWEDDLVRHRQLSSPDRLMVRCTARELREDPRVVARDLRALGVPSRVVERAS